MPRKLSHLDSNGRVRMVDVSMKRVTRRRAVARARIEVGQAVLEQIVRGRIPKGDVLTTARLAGIQAAKETSRLIPLCHPLPLDFVDVRIEPLPEGVLEITSEARLAARTGVEMEALTGAAVAALTVYDMCKSLNRSIVIRDLRLVEKSGGRSGVHRANARPRRRATSEG